MMPPGLPYSASSLPCSSGINMRLFPMPLTYLAKVGWSEAKVKCSRFQCFSDLQGACPAAWLMTPVPEWPWTADPAPPSQWQNKAPGIHSQGESSAEQRWCAQNGHLQGSFVCFRKPLWLIFLTFSSAFPFPPDLSPQIHQYLWTRSGVKWLQRTEVHNN